MPSEADDAIKKEAGRLYTSMFGKLLEDDDETPSRIADRLFLGSAPDARNSDKLKCYDIKYILNMAESTSYPKDFFITSGCPHIRLFTLDAHDLDHFDISSHFSAALNFIHKSLQADDGAVLVHCSAGVSRSATIVAAYLMAAHQIDATEAVQRVNQARPCACPNIGFIQQLLRFDYRGFKFD
ncbi:unnamed protein product [Adineta ricciae]|uniref:protein-tyrosine-phosphatase n=1 Tax=Adineta ricciae TaxID=249248 RepID=A0A815P0N5_ADIRI|nr:unnamed protein product [Adineta ricciae]CAF1522760.1 unnamed protein product [Adineta ricciae]